MKKAFGFLEKYAVAFIVLFPILLHFNGLFNGFALDDFDHVVNNPVVARFDIVRLFLGGAFFRGDELELGGSFYRPLMLSFFALVHSIFGNNAFFFHLLSVIFQCINGVLVFFLFRKAMPKFVSLVLVIMFLSHPINAEVVSNIAHFQELLYLTFGLGAVLFAFNLGKKLEIKSTLVFTALLLFALFAKESAVIFCFIVASLYLLFKRENKALFLGPLGAILLYLFVRLMVAHVPLLHTSITPIMRVDTLGRLMTIPKVIWFYIAVTFYPIELSIGWHWLVKSVNFADFYLPLALVLVFAASLGAIFYFASKREGFDVKFFLFFLSWFLVSFGFHIQIFPIEYTVAERWLYVPFVGLLGMIGTTLQTLNSRQKAGLALLAVVMTAGFSVRTYTRNFDWKDNFTLATRDIAVNDDSFELEVLLGTELLNQKKYEDARVHLQKSVDLNPYWLNINNLATVQLALGEQEKAYGLFRQAAYDYGYFKSYENLASLYVTEDKLDEARQVLMDGLEIYPRNAKLWYITALYQEKIGNKDEAQKAMKMYSRLKE